MADPIIPAAPAAAAIAPAPTPVDPLNDPSNPGAVAAAAAYPDVPKVEKIPTAADIAWLHKDPSNAAGFDKYFGPGAAAKLTSPEATDDTSILGQAAKDTLNAGTSVVRGALKAVDATTGLIKSGMEAIGLPKVSPLDLAGSLPEPSTTVNKLIEGAAEAGAGFIGAGKLAFIQRMAASSSAPIAASAVAVQNAVGTFATFDGHSGNLSTMLASNPALNNTWSTALASKPDDSEAAGRVKNALEATLLGAAGDTALHAIAPVVDNLLYAFKVTRAAQSGNGEAYTKALGEVPEAPPAATAAPYTTTVPPEPARATSVAPKETSSAPPAPSKAPQAEPAPAPAARDPAIDRIIEHVVKGTPIGSTEGYAQSSVHLFANSPENVQRIAEAVGNEVSRAGPITHTQTLAAAQHLAESVDMTPEGVLQFISGNPATDELATRVVAADKLVAGFGQLTDEAFTRAASVPEGSASYAAARADLDAAINTHKTVQQGVLDLKSALGKGLNAAKIGPTGPKLKANTGLTPEEFKAQKAAQPAIDEATSASVRTQEAAAVPNAPVEAHVADAEAAAAEAKAYAAAGTQAGADAAQKAAARAQKASAKASEAAKVSQNPRPSVLGKEPVIKSVGPKQVTDVNGNVLTQEQTAAHHAAVAQKIADDAKAAVEKGIKDRTPIPKKGEEAVPLTDEQYTRLKEALHGITDPDMRARILSAAKDPPEAFHLRAIGVLKNFMVSGVPTQIKQLVSNNINMGNQYYEQWMGALVRGDKASRLAAQHSAFTMGSTLLDGVRVGAKFLSEGRTKEFPTNSIASDVHGKDLRNLSSMVATTTRGQPVKTAIEGIKTLLGDGGFRMLGGSDAMSKYMAYSSKIRGDAYGAGVTQGLKGPDLDNYIRGQVKAAFDPVSGAAINEQALHFAEHTTFQQKIQGDTFIQQMGLGAQGLVSHDNAFGAVMKVSIPFIKTATNILDHFAQRTPLNARLYAEMLSKDPQVSSQAVARWTTGVIHMGAAYALWKNGLATDYGPKDPETRKAWKAAGNVPYSITLPGVGTVPFAGIDPLASHFGTAFDIFAALGHMDQRTAAETAQDLAAVFSNQLASKSMLQGMVQLMEAATDTTGKAALRLVNNKASLVVPNLVSSFNGDPDLRAVKTPVDAIMAKIPGLSDKLAPYRDPLGSPLQPNSMLPKGPVKDNEAYKAIAEAYDAIGERLQPLRNTVHGVDLSSIEKFRPDLGRTQTAYDAVGEAMNNGDVKKRIVDRASDKAFKELDPQSRVDIINSIISSAREEAWGAVYKNPLFHADMEAATRAAAKKNRGLTDYQRMMQPLADQFKSPE